MADPADVSKLDPATMAKHLAKPEGAIGLAVTAGLNKTNAGPYKRAIEKLAITSDDHVFEVGFGNGHEIARLLAAGPGATYSGLDYSESMVAEASARNADLVTLGRVTLKQGTSATIPFASSVFTKALALNTIYFWPNPIDDLREIRRVMASGGRFVLGAIAPWSTDRPFFRHGFTFYEQSQIFELLGHAGFASAEAETLHEVMNSPISGTAIERDYFIVTAVA